MLVDSSVWIAFLRGDDREEVDLLVKALDRTRSVWLAPPILQEVLQGADRPERFLKWDGILSELPMLVEPDARATARAAAAVPAGKTASMASRSASSSRTSSAPRFSSRLRILLVPGIGTMCGPCASTQASASCAGVQRFSSASAFTFPTSARLRAKFSPWKRGLLRR